MAKDSRLRKKRQSRERSCASESKQHGHMAKPLLKERDAYNSNKKNQSETRVHQEYAPPTLPQIPQPPRVFQ
jgi:hypothetical protein